MLKNILPFGKPTELLVCETDGFSLRGAVLKRTGTSFSIMHQANAQTPDMAEAVVEVVAELKKQGWKGGQAILLSPAVLSTLIELPVNPKKTRPIQQMQELIRWEAEPLLMQHSTRWSVGHLLVGRGYMTQEQVDAVMDLQQGHANEAGGLELAEKFSFRRFGELAEELGYIRHSQLNSCLTGQEWLRADDDEIELGWSAQNEVSDVPGMFNWLVSGVNQSLLKRWVGLFSKHGVHLQAMYPLSGCSASLIENNNTNNVILESIGDMVFAMQLEAGKISTLRQDINPVMQPLQLCIESYHTLSPSSSDQLWLANWQTNAATFSNDLQQSLDVKLKLIKQSPIGESVSPGMLGACVHHFAMRGAHLCTSVRVGGQLPPIPQRTEVRGAALLVFFIVAILGAELSLLVRNSIVGDHKAEVDARWKIVDDATKTIKAKKSEIDKRRKVVEKKKKDQVRLDAILSFYSQDIPEREDLVKAIFGVLQNTIPDDVIINSIDEFGKRATLFPAVPSPNTLVDKRVEIENFNLNAWAITEQSAQSFVQSIKEALEPWSVEVRDVIVQADLGPLNLEGFTVAFRLVKLIPADSVTKGAIKK